MRLRCGCLVKGGTEVVGSIVDILLGGGFGAGACDVVRESGFGGIEGSGNGTCGFIVVLVHEGFSGIVAGLNFSGGVDGPVSFLSGGEWFDWIVNESLRWRRSEILSQYFIIIQFEWMDGDGLDMGGVNGDCGVADIFKGFI